MKEIIQRLADKADKADAESAVGYSQAAANLASAYATMKYADTPTAPPQSAPSEE